MKLATFIIKASGQKTIGLYRDEKYLDLVALSNGAIPGSMQLVLEEGPEALQKIRDLADSVDAGQHAYGADEVELQAPVRPGKIIHTS